MTQTVKNYIDGKWQPSSGTATLPVTDSATGEEVAHLLFDLHAGGRTVLIVTHNEHLAAHAPRVVTLVDGAVRRDHHG